MASKEVLKIAGLRLTIDGAAQFNKSLKDINANMKLSSAELAKVTAEHGKNSASAQVLAARQTDLKNKLDLQRQTTQRLNDVLRETEQKFGKNSAEATTLRAKVLESEAAEIRLQKALDKVNGEIDLQNSAWHNFALRAEAVGKKLQSIGDKMQKVGDKMKGLGNKLSVGLTTPIAAAAAGLVKLAGEFDNASDTIRIKTGATGDALKGLETDFEEVLGNVPSTMEDTAGAIADLNTRLGLTGEPLQSLAQQYLELAHITGEDVTASIEESTRAFQAWNIPAEKMGDGLNTIFKVSQATGIKVVDLTKKVTDFAPSLQNLGFTFEESAALIGQFEKAGVNSEAMLAALKKSAATFAKDGKSMSDGLADVTQRIKEAGSETEAARIAIEVFGARAGGDVARQIRAGKLDIDDFAKSIESSRETIGKAAEDTYDYREQLQILKNQLAKELKPVADKLFQAINDSMPTIKKVAEGVGDLVEKFSKLSPETQETILKFAGIAAAAGPMVRVLGSITSGVGSVASAAKTFIGQAATAEKGATGLVGIFEKLGGNTSALTGMMGKLGLAGAIAGVAAGLVGLMIQGPPSRQEIAALGDSIRASKEAFDDTIGSIEANAVLAQKLSDELFDLSEKENKSNAEKYKMQQLVDQLNALYPELRLEIDKTTGELNNERDAIKQVIEQKLKEARLAAYTDRLTQLYKEQIEITDKLKDRQQKLSQYMNSDNKWARESWYVDEYKRQVNDLTGKLDENQKAIMETENEYAAFASGTAKATKDAVDKTEKELKKGAEKTKQGGKNMGKNLMEGINLGYAESIAKVQKHIQDLTKKLMDAIKYIAEITSPSKVTTRYGRYLAEGLGIGYSKEMKRVTRSFQADTIHATERGILDAANRVSSTALAGASDASVPGGAAGSAAGTGGAVAGGIDYDRLAAAMVAAMGGVSIQVDRRTFGRVVSEVK